MAKRTPEQTIAALEAKLARAKDKQRKERTRRLIQIGAMLEPLGEKVEALTPEQRAHFVRRALANFDKLMLTAAPTTPASPTTAPGRSEAQP